MRLFTDRFNSDHAYMNQIIEKMREDNTWTWTVTTTTSIDAVYTCPKCKKQIGLETRFLEDDTKFDCPYCKTEVKVPAKKKEKEEDNHES
jgi:DNA-directed RNA polymerase subunit RPC12/RpoP